MFTTCIHCCEKLGNNEQIEHFPVGEKLAFDSHRGRLWVICPKCSRWNLTPLEERWEAVEECERQFRAERLRAQTTNIGYARTRAGLGLVRIGAPLRPEFAAWRYGREFTRRRARTIAAVGGVAAAGVAFAGLGMAASATALSAALFIPQVTFTFWMFIGTRLRMMDGVSIPLGGGRQWGVSTERTMILPDDDHGWMIRVGHHFGIHEYRGAEAARFLAMVLARVNQTGASSGMIRNAVAEIEQTPAAGLLEQIARESSAFWELDRPAQEKIDAALGFDDHKRPPNRAGIRRISPVKRLALEMALHESTEQKAVDGDLAELEASWRAAEEIAGIADDLLLPPSVGEFISKNKP